MFAPPSPKLRDSQSPRSESNFYTQPSYTLLSFNEKQQKMIMELLFHCGGIFLLRLRGFVRESFGIQFRGGEQGLLDLFFVKCAPDKST